MSIKESKRGEMGFVGTLTLIFAVLKLLNVISWSWFWVLSPIWITVCIGVVIFGTVLISGRIVKGKW
ncbi:MAG: hypothetical protein E7263_10625 [Lachnospiraceae bacterium]|nr:hypothetical protein [Lachnospiraceae bacterium]